MKVEANHDGELDARERRSVGEHLAGCAACAEHLSWLREASRAVSREAGVPLSADHARRLHAALDAIEGDEGAYPLSLSRTAGVLTALAASVLIVSCVWIRELAPTGAPGHVPASLAVAEAPAWERVAVTLRADPLPAHPGGEATPGEAYLADASLADWVLQSLSGRPIDESR